jgi:3-oxoacyl-[acyl-carrier protein] reductase
VAGLSSSADGGYAHYGAAKADRALHALPGAGSGSVRHHRQLHCSGVITTGRIIADGPSRQQRQQSRSVGTGRDATPRKVEDCAKVVEFLATDLSDYVTGAVIPIDGGLRRG